MVFQDFIRRTLILALPAGIEYTVTQIDFQTWSVEIADLSFAPAVQREAGILCRDLKLRTPSLIFAPWLAPHPGEKRRRVRRAFPSP